MNWVIPNAEPYVIYAIKEITRWIGDNTQTIFIITNVLTALKVWAQKSNHVTDDKILTLLLNFFTFRWFRTACGQKAVAGEEEKKEEVK